MNDSRVERKKWSGYPEQTPATQHTPEGQGRRRALWPETCRVGSSAWVGYDAASTVVVMAATKVEAERKYRAWRRAETDRLWMERKAREAGRIT